MKRYKWIAAGFVIVLSLVIVTTVLAFTLGNVDGVWSTIDGGGGASGNTWATGPAGGSTNYDSPTSTSVSDPNIQGPLGGTDWNQVRYGTNSSGGSIPFSNKSGFGFDGVNDVVDPSDPFVGEDFLLGKWCHFNNPIYASNSFEYVDLSFRVDNIVCPDTTTPSPDGTLDFSYRFNLDETGNCGPDCGGTGEPDCTCGYEGDCGRNTAPCPYTVGGDTFCPFDGGINGNGCADQTDIQRSTVAEAFVCDYGGAETDFTIEVLGFVPLANPLATCPDTPSGPISDTYVSGEGADNCACLYAEVTEYQSTGVELLLFEVNEINNKAVTLGWETASEQNNLGFNLYRATSDEGERTKINAEMIPSKVPGSNSGAVYDYTDTVTETGSYFYWLEDVEIDGNKELHGPVQADITEIFQFYLPNLIFGP